MRRIGIALLTLASIGACGKPFFKAGPRPAEPAFPVPASAALVQEINVSYDPCLGTCPAYSFSLSRGGASTYVGQYYTPGATALDAVGAHVEARTDHGTYSVSMQLAAGSPGELEFRALLSTIEEAAGTIVWTPTQRR